MRAKEVLRRRARGGGGGSVGTVCTLATVNNKQPGRVRECYENYVLIHDLDASTELVLKVVSMLQKA